MLALARCHSAGRVERSQHAHVKSRELDPVLSIGLRGAAAQRSLLGARDFREVVNRHSLFPRMRSPAYPSYALASPNGTPPCTQAFVGYAERDDTNIAGSDPLRVRRDDHGAGDTPRDKFDW